MKDRWDFTQARLPLPGGSCFPRPSKAGKPWKQGNGSSTRLKSPSHRVAGLAVNCPLQGPRWLRPSPGGGCHVGDQLGCTVCVHNTAELVSISWGCTVCTLYRMYNVYTVWQCVHLYITMCTLQPQTGFLGWTIPRHIHLYLSWTRQNVVFIFM